MNKKMWKIVIMMIVILAVVIGAMYLIDLNQMKKGEPVVFSTWGAKYSPILKNTSDVNLNANNIEVKTTEVEFIRTYNIIVNLNMTDTIGKHNYYVVQQFQTDEPIVIKVDKKYILEENENYEFTFEGRKTDNKEYTIQEIFETFNITNIEKTDKTGLDQRQDEI